MPCPCSSSTDIVIIGGGIVGTSIAWHLAQRRAGQVHLFDRATVASGASGRTGALLRQHYSNDPELTLSLSSLDVFRHWDEIVGGPPVHSPTPLVVTVDTGPGAEGNLERLHLNVARQNAKGLSSRVISPHELQLLQPFTCVEDLKAAALEPDSGYVDAVAATRGMALAAIAAGATIHEGCGIRRIIIEHDRVVGVETSNGLMKAPLVICAAGPWSAELLTPVGVLVPIEPLRVQVAVLQRPLPLHVDHFTYLDASAGLFFRPYGPGRTLIGVAGGDQHDPVDPNHYDEGNDAGYGAKAIAALARRMPAMIDASYLHGHAGLYDMTPDGHAIIGRAGPDGLVLALGFSGAGFKKGPAVGQAIAEEIVDGKATIVDLSRFGLDRFDSDSWREPWSDTEYILSRDFGHRL